VIEYAVSFEAKLHCLRALSTHGMFLNSAKSAFSMRGPRTTSFFALPILYGSVVGSGIAIAAVLMARESALAMRISEIASPKRLDSVERVNVFCRRAMKYQYEQFRNLLSRFHLIVWCSELNANKR
jgi:hypothetical protein